MKRSFWVSDIEKDKPCLSSGELRKARQVGALITTNQAAVLLGCSLRRVRVLLMQGRLLGELDGGRWLVNSPLRLTGGRRGPQLRAVGCKGVVYNAPERGAR